MKRLTFGFLVALLVVFTGCSQKDVEVTEETKTEQTNKSAETNTQEPVQSQTQVEQTNSEAAAPVVEEQKDEVVKEVVAPMLDNIYFEYDKFGIKGDMRTALKSNYKKLEMSSYAGTVTLEGHCDERGSNEYNFALGLKRAQSVKNELIGYGVDPSQIKIMSFGENKPLCTKQNEACWSKNRRVETVLD